MRAVILTIAVVAATSAAMWLFSNDQPWSYVAGLLVLVGSGSALGVLASWDLNRQVRQGR